MDLPTVLLQTVLLGLISPLAFLASTIGAAPLLKRKMPGRTRSSYVS